MTPHLAAAFLYEWYEVHLRIQDFGQIVESSRYYRVQAEQILNSPEPHMRSIASWLGVRVDEDAIAAMLHPERSPFASPGPDGSIFAGSDPAFLRGIELAPGCPDQGSLPVG